MQNDKPKAVLLIRVSDPRQEREGLSLDNQEQCLRSYADEHQYEVEREFRFQETADQKIRRNFQELVAFVKSRKDVKAIIGYRVDRLTRNYRDHVTLDELRLDHDKELHFVHDRLVIRRDSVGRDITEWDTKVFLAKCYLNRLKEEARTTIRFKLSRGEWPGKAPFGYNNTKRDGRGWIEPSNTDAPVAERIQRLYASGASSMEQVRAAIKREFGREFSKGKIDHIIQNPFYSGWMRFEGRLYRHCYTPILPASVYRRISEVKKSHGKVSYKFAGLEFPYRGIVTCGQCGCRITCERKRKNGRTYHYYHCTQYFGKHQATYLSEAEIDGQFDSLFRGLAIPAPWAIVLEERLGKAQADGGANLEASRKSIDSERKRMQTRLETLYDDRLDGVLTIEAYTSRKERIQQAVAELDQRLGELDSPESQVNTAAIGLVRLCSRVRSAYKVAKPAEKRAILKLLLSNCELDEKRLVWKLKRPFDTVFSYSGRHIWLPLADELRNGSSEFEVTSEEIAEVLKIVSPEPTQVATERSATHVVDAHQNPVINQGGHQK